MKCLKARLAIPLLVLGSSCYSPSTEVLQLAKSLKVCDSAPLKWPAYFPPGTFDEDSDVDRSRNCRHSQLLIALDEEPLGPPGEDVEVYRFSVARNHRAPLVARIERRGSDTVLGKKARYGWGWPPGELVLNQRRAVTASEWQEFAAHLMKANFWGMRPLDRENWVSERAGVFYINLYAGLWVLEALTSNAYRVVVIDSPVLDGIYSDYAELCLYLESLAGLRTPNPVQ